MCIFALQRIVAHTRCFVLIAVTCLLMDFVFLSPSAVHAAAITINTPLDLIANDGLCSLREAITNANNDTQTYADCAPGSGADTIILAAETYNVSMLDTGAQEDNNLSGDLDIKGTLAIEGQGLYNTEISGGDLIRIFDVQPGAKLTLSYLGVVHGYSSTNGGGIQNRGTLTLVDARLQYNRADIDGGGIYNYQGAMTLESTISDNSAGRDGGGVANAGGIVTFNDRQISSNTAMRYGGGISNNGQLIVQHVWLYQNESSDGSGGNLYNTNTATINDSLILEGHAHNHGGNIFSGNTLIDSLLTVNRTTIAGGTAAENGGAIYNLGTLNVTNSTLAENKADTGTAIYNAASTQPTSLLNTTVVSNTAWLVGTGAGLENSTGGPFTLKNTLVAYNGNAGNCIGTFVSQGYNLEFGTSCQLLASGDLHTAPKLGPFQENGGFRFPYGGEAPTFAPLLGSPVVNAGTNVGCPATDQRGVMRPHGQHCDIGALETNNAPTVNNDTYSTAEDVPLMIAAPGVQANDSDPDNDILTSTVVLDPQHGILVLQANGAFHYTPAADYHGADSFTYQVSDGSLASGVATVNIAITSVNDPPIARNDTANVTTHTALSIPVATLLDNDTDPESNPLTIISVHNPSARGGSVVLDGTTVTYISAIGFIGQDTFTYTISDGQGGTATATVVVNVGQRALHIPIITR